MSFRFIKSLTFTTLVKMGLRIAIVIIAVTITSYWHIMSNLESQVIAQLEKYITERGQREANLFSLAETYHTIFKKEFISRYQTMGDVDPVEEFNHLFNKLADGTTRIRPEEYYGVKKPNGFISKGVTGFIDKKVVISPEIRRQLVIAYDMLSAYGPVWEIPFQNFYITTPENIVLVRWPGVPWYLEVTAELDMTQEEWMYIADKQHNPERKTAWTGLLYDGVAKDWMVSCITPVDIAGKHVVSIGNDILLNDLIERTINDHLEGAYNFIVREDSRLLIHPSKIADIQAAQGAFYVQQSNNDNLIHQFQLIKNAQRSTVVIENKKNHEYLAVTKMASTGWYFVVVYPKLLLARLASETAQFIFALGVLSLLIEISILFFVLRKQISKPLNQFIEATEQMASGRFNMVLDAMRQDELGHLAESFNKMVAEIQAREDSLKQAQCSLQQEIDKHKQTEMALRNSETRFELAMRGANDGLWDWDLIKNEVYYSPRYKQMLGHAEHEIKNHPDEWAKRVYPDDIQPALAAISSYLKKEKPTYEVIFRMQHKNGYYLWILSRGFAVFDEQGNPTRLVGTHVDFTPQKQIEEELRAAKETAEIANQAKSAFLANMSHELRTPLNGILGYTQILARDSALTSKQREGINIIHRSGEYLLTLINDVLDLSKIEAGKEELHLVDLNFFAFLEEIVELFQIRAQQKGIAFVYEPLSQLPVGIRSDSKRLRQILINLLGNAIKFTERGGVTFKVDRYAGRIRFQIEDTGPGIAAEDIEKIFQPFQQIGDQLRKAEGTGLGLPIVKRLVEIMGGEIQVKSTVGRGSTFSVVLDFLEVSELVKSEKTKRPCIVGFHEKPCRILVVDDRWENRSVMVNLLTPLGFEVIEATDGKACLDTLASAQPQLILMDLVMPVMDGFEAARQIRKNPDFKNIPIIVASASVFEHHQQKSIAAGCNDFMTKPFQAETLLTLLQKYLNLTWIYEEVSETATVLEKASTTNTALFVGPSPEQATTLQNLAMMGDIKGILNELDVLEAENRSLKSFIDTVRQLAKEFKEEQICELIEPFTRIQ